jgi:hypothetical protein
LLVNLFCVIDYGWGGLLRGFLLSIKLFFNDSAPRARQGRRFAGIAGVVLLYVALTAVMTYPQARFLTDTVVPEFGDPLLSTLHLYDANIFHPERHTLAFSDAMLVPALTVAPLVWLGVHPIVAYNLLFLSGFVFSGVAMFVLVRSLTGHVPAALLAGAVFAFLPYRFMHYAHLELQMAQWMPLGLWALHKTVDGGRLRDGLLVGLFLALQTLSSWYYGIFFATYLAMVGGVLLLGTPRENVRRTLRPLAAGAVLAGLLTLPFALPYFAARQSVGERAEDEIRFYSAEPNDYRAVGQAGRLPRRPRGGLRDFARLQRIRVSAAARLRLPVPRASGPRAHEPRRRPVALDPGRLRGGADRPIVAIPLGAADRAHPARRRLPGRVSDAGAAA